MTDTADAARVDIVIAGGGMVGLSLALLLAREVPDLSIALVEASSMPEGDPAGSGSFDGRSTAMSGGTAQLLDAMGAWQPLADSAAVITQVDVTDRGHLGRTRYPDTPGECGALGYIVENARLGQALAAQVKHCSQVSVMAPAIVDKVEPRRDGARVSVVRDGQVSALDCSLVVVADGTASPLRNKLGIGADVHDYGQHAVVTNVQHQRPHGGVAFERFSGDGPMALLPRADSGGATSALVWTRPAQELEATLALDDTAFLERIQTLFGDRLGRFTRVGARASYPLSLTLAKEQVRSGLVLVGNAAHFLHPVAGQGFNLAMRDCAQLVAVLAAAHEAGEPLGTMGTLKQYLARQQADQDATTLLSHSFNALFTHSGKPVQLGRNLGLLALQGIKPLREDFFAQMMGRGAQRAPLKIMRRHQAGAALKGTEL